MDYDPDGAALSAPRSSRLQELRRQWRERQQYRDGPGTPSPLLQTPTRRLADLLAAAESPVQDVLACQRLSPSLQEPCSDTLAKTWQDQLPEPGEEAFVAARASVRRDEYLKLESWLMAGGSPEPFAPWFRELLMDMDDEAFAAACRAVASHYRRAAEQRALGLDTAAAPCRPWLPGFLERLRTSSPKSLKQAVELVAALLAAPRHSRTATSLQRHEFFDELCSLPPSAGAESLLRGCEAHGALQKEDLDELRRIVAPAPALPVGKQEVPHGPHLEQSSFLASPMRPVAQGPEDPLRLLGTASPKSWRQRLEALETIQGPDADGVHGQLLWPQLVLQAEDDHPAVAAASLRCLARLAPLLSAPGDHLLARLAAAVKACSKGRLREKEAARVLLGAAARCPRAVGGPAGLGAFLGLALGLQKDRAKALVLELMAERHQPANAGGSGLPAPLEALLQELGKLRPPEIRRGGFTPSPSRRHAALGSPDFPQGPRISPVQKATPSTTSPGFLAFAEALPDPDSVPPLCRFASPVKLWKQVRPWEARTPDTIRGSATSFGPSLPSESRLLSLSQAPSPEDLGDTQSTAMGTSPEDPISPEAPIKPDGAEEGEGDEEDEEEEAAFLESFLTRLDTETPKAVAQALAQSCPEAARAVDFLLSCLLTPPGGVSSGKLAELLQSFVEELLSGDRDLRDLDLPSLPAVVDAASAGRLSAALPALRRGLEPLLRHLAPGAVPETCWTQLRRILAE
ncbi:kanC, partial [Symbiodinium natans]